MTAILNELKHIDADASDRVRRIRDLRGLSAEFESALERAGLALDQHSCMIESEEIALSDLRARAVELAAFIGQDGIEEVIDHDTGREPADEMEAFPTIDVASEVIDLPEVLIADTPEEITEAVATLADEPMPDDPSDAPELTTDECETYEDTVREADRELETIWR